jgi:coenzyme F420-reducing hydrogenase alpha subunit
MSAVHAMEDAFGVHIDPQIRALRRLLYCGEWIESHTLHVFMLHAPDFLGYVDVVQMAQDHSEVVKRALELKKVGNAVITLLGGRAIHPVAQEAARAAGLGTVCQNPFQSIIVLAVEILHACDEALRLIDQYEMPDQPAAEMQPRAATCYACTEAPRGMLYHRYRLDAKIVPPTSQNQKIIENDLRQLIPQVIGLPEDQLTWRCEQAIRNYDPCISCSTHFLKLYITRE